MKKILLLIVCLWPALILAQAHNVQSVIDNLIERCKSGEQVTIQELDITFKDIDISAYNDSIQFYYHYLCGNVYQNEQSYDKAFEHFWRLRAIAGNSFGIRNLEYLHSLSCLAECSNHHSNPKYSAIAPVCYNEMIVIGISLLEYNNYINDLLIEAWMGMAKMGEQWQNDNYVKGLWQYALNFAAASEDPGTALHYVILNLSAYYWNIGLYDDILYFMRQVKSKGIIDEIISGFINQIEASKGIAAKEIEIIAKYGRNSAEFYRNKLDQLYELGSLGGDPLKILCNIEEEMCDNNLAGTQVYAEILYTICQLLSNELLNSNEVLTKQEKYAQKNIEFYNSHPELFVFWTDVDVYNYLGVAQMKQGKYALAHTNFIKAKSILEVNDASQLYIYAVVLHNLGRNYQLQGTHKLAIDYLSQSVELQNKIGPKESIISKTTKYLNESLSLAN